MCKMPAELRVDHCAVDSVIPADEACDLEISGVDAVRGGQIPGGVDGIYKISGCFAGFPLYKREGKTKNGRS